MEDEYTPDPDHCAVLECEATHSNYGPGRSKWFKQWNGDSWCPEHIPDWVESWRERQKENKK